MVRARKTVNASVLATPVGIDARIESNVGTVVVINDASSLVLQEYGLPRRIIGFLRLPRLIGEHFKPICGITSGAAASLLFTTHNRHYNSRL